MADTKISALPSATTPLAGTEVLPLVQAGGNVKVAVSDLTAGRAVSALSFAGPLNGTVGATTPTTGAFTTLTDTGLTSGRVTFASTGGLLVDSANMTFNGNSLTVSGGVSLTTNAAKFQSTYSGVTTTNLFTDSGGGVISVDGSNTISLRTGGISGTSVAVVSSTGLAVTGTLSATNLISSTFDGAGNPWLSRTGATANAQFIAQGNTGGVVYAGIETSGGGTLITGSTGYAFVFRSPSTPIQFSANGGTSPQMTLDSSGNLGVGTSSPVGRLEAVGGTGAGFNGWFRTGDATAANNAGGGFYNTSSATATSRRAVLALDADGANLGGGDYFVIEKSGNSGTVDLLQYSNAAMRFGTNYTSRATFDMTLDSSGNLGIGNSSPQALLHVGSVVEAPGFGTASQMCYVNGTSQPEVLVRETTNDVVVSMFADSTSGAIRTATNHPLVFYTNNAERARIDSSGNLLVGTTSFNYAANGVGLRSNAYSYFTATSSAPLLLNLKTTTGTIVSINFDDSGVGSISTSGTVTLYNTTSDQRLKENIQDAAPASALIDSLQVRQFDWKKDNTHQRYGFVAQELVTVAPEAVHAPADPEEMMAVDYSKLVPLLVKELQSLRARVAQLESKP